MSRKLCNSKDLPMVFDQVITAPIIALLLVGCPYAIGWAVVAIVVESFYHMLRARPWSHVGIKSLKGWPDNRNTSCPIMLIHGRIGVHASFFHGMIDAVLWRSRAPMLGSSLPRFFTLQTSTASCFATTQVRSPYNDPCATLAQTRPADSAICGVRSAFDNTQSSERLP